MTQIDFYILSEQSAHNRDILSCRLAEKVYKLGNRLYIHTATQAEASRVDDLLWTYRDGSFLPHEIYRGELTPAATPIIIGHDQESCGEADVLINLAPAVPLFFSRFERVAEIISQQTADKNSGRERYRFYRDRGYALKTHNI
jgi:DNA polymerase-3 subunit chi